MGLESAVPRNDQSIASQCENTELLLHCIKLLSLSNTSVQGTPGVYRYLTKWGDQSLQYKLMIANKSIGLSSGNKKTQIH